MPGAVVDTGDKMNTARSGPLHSRAHFVHIPHKLLTTSLPLSPWCCCGNSPTGEVTHTRGHTRKRKKRAHDSVCLCPSPEKGLIPVHSQELSLPKTPFN